MTSVVVGTWMLERPGDLLNSLSLAALLILIAEPGQLFQAGFLLSFLVVAALAVFPSRWEAWWLEHRPWRPDALLPPSQWSRTRRVWEWAERGLCRGCVTGLAALVASWPMSVECFHLVSVVSVVANLIVVPLSSLVLIANALSMGLPVGTELWNSAAWVGMHGMMAASRACEAIPGGWWSAASPGAWVWIPYALLWVVAAAGWLDTQRRRRLWWGGAAVWLVLLLGARHIGEPAASVTVFRSGEAVWIDRPGSAADLLLDTGDAATAKAVVLPWLQSQGVDRVPTLAVSHGDVRHVGGVPVMITNASPHRLVLPVGRVRSPSFRGLDGLAASNGVPLQRVRRGDAVAGIPVLHPDQSDAFSRADDGALVLSLEAAGWRILLAPDLGPEGQRALIQRGGASLAADVLITGNPASGEAASEALLAQVNPRLLVVATGDRPATERSSPALRRRLRERLRDQLQGRPETTLWTERIGALQLRCWDNRLEVRDSNGELRWRLERPVHAGAQGSATAW
jgi:competence protein ComEC